MKRWKPRDGEEYFWVSLIGRYSDCYCRPALWNADNWIDQERWKMRNVFRSEKEANRIIAKIKRVLKEGV